MSDYGSYTDGNLILYDETIRLWSIAGAGGGPEGLYLELKDYADVFGTGPADAVSTLWVGLVRENGALRSITPQDAGMSRKSAGNIGERLDATDVIRFQRAVCAWQAQADLAGFTGSLDYAVKAIQAGLQHIEQASYRLPVLAAVGDIQQLRAKLKEIRHTSSLLDPDQYRKYEAAGFKDRRGFFRAYFPKPCLILQEERTYFQQSAGLQGDPDKIGKTMNADLRAIRPVGSSLPRPAVYEFDDLLKKGISFDRICCYAFRSDSRDPIKIYSAAGLLPQVTRTDRVVYCQGKPKIRLNQACKSDLAQKIIPQELVWKQDDLFKDGGKNDSAKDFELPTVKHIDPLVKKGEEGKWWVIEYRRKPPSTGRDRRFVILLKEETNQGVTVQTGLEVYDEAIEPTGETPVLDLAKELDENRVKDVLAYYESMETLFLNLERYIQDERFKGYVSTTLSVSIGKCFGNLYAGAAQADRFLYVVRCVGGFLIPSAYPEFIQQVQQEKGRDSNFNLAKIKIPDPRKKFGPVVRYYEQEVSVPGAIWWDRVAGFRINRCNGRGQFLAGPVFINEWVRDLDRGAFGALFELLSGRSQSRVPGGCSPMIEPSYQPARGYDFVPNTDGLPQPAGGQHGPTP
jgi:hypothetical protein